MIQELDYIRCGDYFILDINYKRKPDLLVDEDGYTENI